MEELLEIVEKEGERFNRYKTPFIVVLLSINIVDKNLQIQYLHKLIMKFKNEFEKIKRKIDYIFRYKNSIIFVLPNLDLDKGKGFIDRIFYFIDKSIKENYINHSQENDFVLIDSIIKVHLILYSTIIPSNLDNVIFFDQFNREDFIENINNPCKTIETWQIRLPLIEKL